MTHQATATGRIMLPDGIKVVVKPMRAKGKYTMVYEETLPTADRTIVGNTIDMCKRIGPNIKVVKRTKRSTTIRMTMSSVDHATIGSMLGFEFLVWSPLGKMSIMELILSGTFRKAGETEFADALEGNSTPRPVVVSELDFSHTPSPPFGADYEVKS